MKVTFVVFLHICYGAFMKKSRGGQDAARALALAGELRVLLGQLKRRLVEQTRGDLSWPQKTVLLRIERDGPATVTALARAEGVRPQSMGATVSALEEAGLVSGAADPADGRQTIWSLTPACREIVKAGRAAREDWLFQAIQTKFKPGERQELAAAISLLKRFVED
jgi:DNA-binding MarR family transcriptional regulator